MSTVDSDKPALGTSRRFSGRRSFILMLFTIIAAVVLRRETSGEMYLNLLSLGELRAAVGRSSTFKNTRYDGGSSDRSSSSPLTVNNFGMDTNATPGTLSAFEQHYLFIYESMIIRREIPPKFVLWSLDTHGLGNKVRSLNGAIFLAAITDRVLLVSSPPFTSLFDPPVLNGVVLDWNLTIAVSMGMCNSTRNNATTVILDSHEKNADFAASYVNFAKQYDDVACLIAAASHGHDRQVATYNEATYKRKIARLFNHATSRYQWTQHCLKLVLQRPKPEVRAALAEAMNRLGLDSVPPSHRIGVHIRTFYDMPTWQSVVMSKASRIFSCLELLVRGRIADIGTLYDRSTKNVSISILFVSDSPDLKAEALKRLRSKFPSVSFTESWLIVQTRDERTGAGSVSGDDYYRRFASIIEWFLLGECSFLVGSGASSFGLSAHFRPAIFPPQHTTSIDDGRVESSKLLNTIDRLALFQPKYLNMGNVECGRVAPEGYGDINFGVNDPVYKTRSIQTALQTWGDNSSAAAASANFSSNTLALLSKADITMQVVDRKAVLKGSILTL